MMEKDKSPVSEDGRSDFVRIALTGLGFFLYLAASIDSANFVVDDVFIPLRYAENWASGLGPVFNPGERVEGFSNPLWTALLALLSRIGLSHGTGMGSLLVASKFLGFVFGLGTLAVVAWVAPKLHWPMESSMWRSVLQGLCVTVLGSIYTIGLWSVSGMETALCMFLLTAGIAVHLAALARMAAGDEVKRETFLWGGILLGLATLVRPEQIFIFALATLGFLFWARDSLVRRYLIASGLITVVLYGFSLLLRWQYYGQLLPNSVTAKSGGGLMTLVLGTKYTLAGFAETLGFVGIGILALPFLTRSHTQWKYIVCFCGAYVMFLLASGGDWMPGFRYHMPVLPIFAILLVAGVGHLLAPFKSRLATVLITLVVFLMSVGSFSLGRSHARDAMHVPSGFRWMGVEPFPNRHAFAQKLAEIVPAGSTVALGECGYFPYFNMDVRFLDLHGLMDLQIAKTPGRLHFRKVDKIFFEREPDFYLFMITKSRSDLHSHAILSTPEFDELYELALFYDTHQIALESTLGGTMPSMEEDASYVLYRKREKGDSSTRPR